MPKGTPYANWKESTGKTKPITISLPIVRCTQEWLDKSKQSNKRITAKYGVKSHAK